MVDICDDNRFEIIEKAKEDILNRTNIHTSEDEMKVLDDFLFRCWQMGWLDRYNTDNPPVKKGELIMTQKEIDKLLANTKVYVAGKSEEIQEKLFTLGYCWQIGGSTEVKLENEPFLFIYNTHDIACGSNMLTFTQCDYREITADEILSIELTEPNYRPFKDKEECWNEMLKHQPFGWYKRKERRAYENWVCVGNKGVEWTSFDEAYKNCTFADGTPFGIKED